MDEDVEGMQSTIYLLQQQLKDAKDQIAQLQLDNAQLRKLSGSDATSALAQHATDVSMDTDDCEDDALRTREQQVRSSESATGHRKELRQTNNSSVDDDVTSPEQLVTNGYSAENDSDDDSAPPRKLRKSGDADAPRRTGDRQVRDDDARDVSHRNGTADDSYDSPN